MHPIVVSMIDRYRIKGFPGSGYDNTGRFWRYCIICSKTNWHQSSHWNFFPFFKRPNSGSQVKVNLEINRLMNCTLRRKPRTSFSVLGGDISKMALILEGSTSIPLCVIKNPSIFPAVTPNVHYWGLSRNRFSLIRWNNFCKTVYWPSLTLDLTIMSSTYTSTSLWIMSWRMVGTALWLVAPAFFKPNGKTW